MVIQNMNFFASPLKGTSRLLVLSLVTSLVLSIGSTQAPALASSSGTTCTPDFTLTGSSPQTITAGATGHVSFVVTSVCGLYGTVLYHVSISPSEPASIGIALHQPTYNPVVLSTTHPSAAVGFQVLTTANTLVTTWTITITASVLNVVHTTNIIVNTNAYTITASPSSLSAPLGQPVKSMITLNGFGGYSGTIYYSISISPNPPAVGSNSCFNPVPGGPTLTPSSTTATSQWTCTITPKGTYAVTITATPLNGAPDLSTTITVKVT